MLGLGFQLSQSVRQSHELLPPLCQDLFPRAALLLAETDYQRALEFVSGRRRMEDYRSMMDFLFAESVWGYRTKCFAFYRDEAPALRELPESTPEQIARWDRFLVEVLRTAKDRLEVQRQIGWRELYRVHRHLLKAA